MRILIIYSKINITKNKSIKKNELTIKERFKISRSVIKLFIFIQRQRIRIVRSLDFRWNEICILRWIRTSDYFPNAEKIWRMEWVVRPRSSNVYVGIPMKKICAHNFSIIADNQMFRSLMRSASFSFSDGSNVRTKVLSSFLMHLLVWSSTN